MRTLTLLLLSTSLASAADLPAVSYKPAPTLPAVAVDWSGLSLGAHLGGVWARPSTTDLNGGVFMQGVPFTYSTSGILGGGQVAYLYQHSSGVVIGPELDFGYMGLSGKGIIPSSNPLAHQDLTLRGGFYANLTGKVGYAIGDWLPYIKGGYSHFSGSANQQTTNPGYASTPTGSFSGSVLGGGLAYRLNRNISLSAEYLHYDYGTRNAFQTSISDPPIGFVYNNSTRLTADSATLRADWHF